MGRCPKFLNVNDFDRLAADLNLTLTDGGVSVLGEITEYIATEILLAASQEGQLGPVDLPAVITAARSLGISLELNSAATSVLRAGLRTPTAAR